MPTILTPYQWDCSPLSPKERKAYWEDGNYEELIGKNGYFVELVRRQRVEDD